MTGEDALKIIVVLTAAYPKTEMTEETAELYIQFLLDLPFEAGKAAALTLIAEGKWMPSIAELRQVAVNLLPANQVPSSAEAYAEVVYQMRYCFVHQSPKFSHPAIEKAVKAMGWSTLCKSDNPITDRTHFIKIYDSYRERAIRDIVQTPEIKILIEQANQRSIGLPNNLTNKIKSIAEGMAI